jgi:hypothetical protein
MSRAPPRRRAGKAGLPMKTLWPIAWLCAAIALFPPGSLAAANAEGSRWQAVVVAGDTAQPVFDNAIRSVERFLEREGVPQANIHRFSAGAGPSNPSAAPATTAAVLTTIAQLPVRPGDRCFVFITSHGERGEGIWLAYSREMLGPAALARALAGRCAAVPTVVIVSGCYSGTFARPPMTAPTRFILTAARADRPSFGCQADRVYTVYDACLLGVLPRAATWDGVYRGTAACVSRRERELSVLPSVPQAWFGAAVGGMRVRF